MTVQGFRSSPIDSRQDLSGKSLLIVDDNGTNRRILSQQAQFWQMQVEVASSASEALELLASGRHYDIGIVDMQMPGIDGLILAK